MSKVNRPPMSISRLVRYMRNKEDKIACIVGTVTDDTRLLTVPKLSICALRFTATARARIVKAGGECITFDQLALRAPTGTGTVLLRGRKLARETVKYWGAAGVPGSSTKSSPHYTPCYVCSALIASPISVLVTVIDIRSGLVCAPRASSSSVLVVAETPRYN
jgi:ribosomal protein L18E